MKGWREERERERVWGDRKEIKRETHNEETDR